MEQRKGDYSRDIKALRDRITLYHRQERRFQCDDIGKNAGRVHPARIGVILLVQSSSTELSGISPTFIRQRNNLQSLLESGLTIATSSNFVILLDTSLEFVCNVSRLSIVGTTPYLRFSNGSKLLFNDLCSWCVWMLSTVWTFCNLICSIRCDMADELWLSLEEY